MDPGAKSLSLPAFRVRKAETASQLPRFEAPRRVRAMAPTGFQTPSSTDRSHRRAGGESQGAGGGA